MNPATITPTLRRPGIQPGQNVSLGQPMMLEKSVRQACEGALATAQAPEGHQLIWSKGLTGSEIAELAARRGLVLPKDFRIAGLEPDGGLFCLQKGNAPPEPFLIAEAKFQGEAGNAIERWHKNSTLRGSSRAIS